MKCSPIYYDEKGNKKNEERLNVDGACNDSCIHFEACKKELNVPADYTTPRHREENPSENDLAKGRWHWKKELFDTIYYVENGKQKKKNIYKLVKRVWNKI